MGRLIEGGGVGRPNGKNLQILDLHRLACLCKVRVNANFLRFNICVWHVLQSFHC